MVMFRFSAGHLTTSEVSAIQTVTIMGMCSGIGRTYTTRSELE